MHRARWTCTGPLIALAALAAWLVGCGGAPVAPGESDAERHHPLVGVLAPALGTAPPLRPAELPDFQGKVVVVEFWATWCEPCVAAFPKLAALNAKYAQNLAMIAVSEDDDRDSIAEFAQAHGANFEILWDEGKRTAGRWQPHMLPATFVLDRRGVVRFVHIGHHDGEEEAIEKELKLLL